MARHIIPKHEPFALSLERLSLIVAVAFAAYVVLVFPALQAINVHVKTVDERCVEEDCTFCIYYAFAYPYCTIAIPTFVTSFTYNDTHVRLGTYVCNTDRVCKVDTHTLNNASEPIPIKAHLC